MEMDALLEFLRPVEGNETWDYVLYGLFAMGLFTMAFMGSKSTQMDVYFVTISVFLVVLDKLYIAGFIFPPVETPGTEIESSARVAVHIDHFFTYAIRVMIFVLPLVVAGNTKNGRVRILAGLYAIIGAVYSFARWFFQIRDETEMQSALLLQGTLLLLVVGELLCRWYLRYRRRVDGHTPFLVTGVLATHNAEVDVAQFANDRAHLAVSDRSMINLSDSGNLHARSTEEGLVTDIELGTVDGALFNR